MINKLSTKQTRHMQTHAVMATSSPRWWRLNYISIIISWCKLSHLTLCLSISFIENSPINGIQAGPRPTKTQVYPEENVMSLTLSRAAPCLITSPLHSVLSHLIFQSFQQIDFFFSVLLLFLVWLPSLVIPNGSEETTMQQWRHN